MHLIKIYEAPVLFSFCGAFPVTLHGQEQDLDRTLISILIVLPVKVLLCVLRNKYVRVTLRKGPLLNM